MTPMDSTKQLLDLQGRLERLKLQHAGMQREYDLLKTQYEQEVATLHTEYGIESAADLPGRIAELEAEVTAGVASLPQQVLAADKALAGV